VIAPDAASGEAKTTPNEAIIAIYSVLANRYNANIALQWQIPTLSLTAQSFVIAASATSVDYLSVQVALSVAICAIGIGSVLIMRRIELTAFMDRPMLDRYEELLVANSIVPPLHHGGRIPDREAVFAGHLGGEQLRQAMVGRSWLGRSFLFNSLARRVKPSLWWTCLQLTLTLVGAALPALYHLP
jgi:hypothetical protein